MNKFETQFIEQALANLKNTIMRGGRITYNLGQLDVCRLVAG